MAKNNPPAPTSDELDDQQVTTPPPAVDPAELERLENELTKYYAVNDQLRAEIAELKNQIAALTEKLNGTPKVRAVGHLMEPGDPFADGALRAYLKQRPECSQPKMLPFVLPYNDPASTEALKNYRLRAAAAGDAVRVKAADAALAKCVK